jgi:glycosyltransferase involved in cell wall biosynthesis
VSGIRITVVIPFLDCLDHLKRTVPTILEAARHTRGVEVIYVDNGSGDGSAEYVSSVANEQVQLLRLEHATISQMRNWGVAHGTGEYLSFLDADCGIERTYFDDALAVMRATHADATGCEYALPDKPHWIEKTLRDLHFVGRDRDVIYINGGNLFITRAAFDSVNGFREELRTGEDSDLGHRLTRAGRRLYESSRVRAIHYGNPKSLRQHYRRIVWHGLGTFGTLTRHRLDRPTVMLAVHIAATVAGIAALFADSVPLIVRVAVFAALQLLVPVVTVSYRVVQTRRIPRLDHATLVYWVYYWARISSLALLATPASARFRR